MCVCVFLIGLISTWSHNYNTFAKGYISTTPILLSAYFIFHSAAVVGILLVTVLLCLAQQGPQGFTGPPGESGEAGSAVSMQGHKNESTAPVLCLGELLLTPPPSAGCHGSPWSRWTLWKEWRGCESPAACVTFWNEFVSVEDRVWTRIQELKASPLTFLGRVWQTRSLW